MQLQWWLNAVYKHDLLDLTLWSDALLYFDIMNYTIDLCTLTFVHCTPWHKKGIHWTIQCTLWSLWNVDNVHCHITKLFGPYTMYSLPLMNSTFGPCEIFTLTLCSGFFDHYEIYTFSLCKEYLCNSHFDTLWKYTLWPLWIYTLTIMKCTFDHYKLYSFTLWSVHI